MTTQLQCCECKEALTWKTVKYVDVTEDGCSLYLCNECHYIAFRARRDQSDSDSEEDDGLEECAGGCYTRVTDEYECQVCGDCFCDHCTYEVNFSNDTCGACIRELVAERRK